MCISGAILITIFFVLRKLAHMKCCCKKAKKDAPALTPVASDAGGADRYEPELPCVLLVVPAPAKQQPEADV
jgi:hypothetical protein